MQEKGTISKKIFGGFKHMYNAPKETVTCIHKLVQADTGVCRCGPGHTY